MEGVTFSTPGGGGGAGIFSALEWIMKGAVWLRAAAVCVCRTPDGGEELRAGEGARLCRRLAVFGIDGTTFLVYGHLCVKYEKSSLKSASENK